MGLLALPLTAAERWLMLIIAFAVVFGAGVVGGIHYEGTVRDAREAKQVQAQLQAQIAATQRTLTEEHRRQDAVQEIANETHLQAEHYAAAAADNRAAGERLREQLASCGRSSAASPAAAAGSAPADPAAGVLADVQRRLEEAENRTIEFADASHLAGLACQRSFDALTVTP